MPLRLPVPKRIPLSSDPEALVAELQRSVDAGRVDHGYVRVQTGGGAHFLFLLNGSAFCAGVAQEERIAAAPFARFFRALELRGKAELCPTDLPLFLCTAVLFRKAPAAQLPANLVDSAALLEHIARTGKDAVLVIRSGSARSLAFCHNGSPVALYPAEGERHSDSKEVADRIMEYVYGEQSDSVVMDLYDEIKLPPAADAGQALDRYRQTARGGSDGPEPAIVVSLGGRPVFRFPVLTDLVTVGRGGQNDLGLDNLSVSRDHARVRRRGDSLVFEDLGSENGLLVGGKKVASVALLEGESVELGKYTLTHRIFAPWEQGPEVKHKTTAVASVEETIAMTREQAGIAELEHDGQRHRVAGQLFSIGRQATASLRIRGMLIAPLHAQIERSRDGSYSLRHVEGRAAVKINGERIKRAPLTDGDEIKIGSEVMRFRLIISV